MNFRLAAAWPVNVPNMFSFGRESIAFCDDALRNFGRVVIPGADAPLRAAMIFLRLLGPVQFRTEHRTHFPGIA